LKTSRQRYRKRQAESAINELRKWARSDKMMELPLEAIDEAIELFKTLQKEGFHTGYSAMINALASLFYVIKTDPSCPAISFRQFKEALPVKKDGFTPIYNPKQIFRAYKKIVEKYGIGPQTCTLRPVIFVKKFGPMMGFDSANLEKAVVLAKEIIERRIHQGRSPIVSAAACLAAIDSQFGKKRDRREIAELCGVTDSAISVILDLPFFQKRFPSVKSRKKKPVSKIVLIKLLRKLVKETPARPYYDQSISFHALQRSFHLAFQKELEHSYVPWKNWIYALEVVKSDGLIIVTIKQTCKVLLDQSCHLKDINCFRCAEMQFWKPCLAARIIIKSQKPTIAP
jgi:hypothetical protein